MKCAFSSKQNNFTRQIFDQSLRCFIKIKLFSGHDTGYDSQTPIKTSKTYLGVQKCFAKTQHTVCGYHSI